MSNVIAMASRADTNQHEVVSQLSKQERQVIKDALAILDRHLRKVDFAFTEPSAVKNYLRLQLEGKEREQFNCLFLDNQHRLIKDEVLFLGTIDASPVYPRVVVQKALKYNASAIALAHNHPSGVAEPSRADRSITQRLVNALGLVDVRVLDHFVVGDSEIISFAERGWI